VCSASASTSSAASSSALMTACRRTRTRPASAAASPVTTTNELQFYIVHELQRTVNPNSISMAGGRFNCVGSPAPCFDCDGGEVFIGYGGVRCDSDAGYNCFCGGPNPSRRPLLPFLCRLRRLTQVPTSSSNSHLNSNSHLDSRYLRPAPPSAHGVSTRSASAPADVRIPALLHPDTPTPRMQPAHIRLFHLTRISARYQTGPWRAYPASPNARMSAFSASTSTSMDKRQ
jgi:hypothetical protein